MIEAEINGIDFIYGVYQSGDKTRALFEPKWG